MYDDLRWIAPYYCELDAVKYLLEKGVNIHFDYDDVLRYSAENGHLDVVKYLVERS